MFYNNYVKIKRTQVAIKKECKYKNKNQCCRVLRISGTNKDGGPACLKNG
ncbi:hypothetical protein DOY81_003902 [Sarcophaga bullata]|nr:hypothetical protein DOY81_003902 [Sarcophaga bullata]